MKTQTTLNPIMLASILILITAGGIGCGIEKKFIFFPDKKILETPADISLAYEDIYLLTPDGIKINGWFVPFLGARSTLLWFHGNAGNLSHRVDQLRHIHRKLKLNVLMIDYREYGRSEGSVTEEGTYQDALASYDYLATRTDIDPKRIVVFGQSLGAAVAVELAIQRKVYGLILEAPFTSIKDMARVTLPWLPIGPLLTTRYDSLSKIGRIEAPLLILHGDRDEIIPYSQGRQIFEVARESKTFYTITAAGHNDTYVVGGQSYFEAIAYFISGLK
jgi:hypothetical protein